MAPLLSSIARVTTAAFAHAPSSLHMQSFRYAGRQFASSSRVSLSAKRSEVILVGCGAPDRGMGWYHSLQMLQGSCPSAHLTTIVEPWFLGAGADGPGGKEFAD